MNLKEFTEECFNSLWLYGTEKCISVLDVNVWAYYFSDSRCWGISLTKRKPNEVNSIAIRLRFFTPLTLRNGINKLVMKEITKKFPNKGGLYDKDIIEDCKKLLGFPPYNTANNQLYGDGYFGNSLHRKYGEDKVKSCIKDLERGILR